MNAFQKPAHTTHRIHTSRKKGTAITRVYTRRAATRTSTRQPSGPSRTLLASTPAFSSGNKSWCGNIQQSAWHCNGPGSWCVVTWPSASRHRTRSWLSCTTTSPWSCADSPQTQCGCAWRHTPPRQQPSILATSETQAPCLSTAPNEAASRTVQIQVRGTAPAGPTVMAAGLHSHRCPCARRRTQTVRGCCQNYTTSCAKMTARTCWFANPICCGVAKWE